MGDFLSLILIIAVVLFFATISYNVYGRFKYRSKCSGIVLEFVKKSPFADYIPLDECKKYVGDHMGLFRQLQLNKAEPQMAVYTASKMILFSLRDRDHEAIRSHDSSNLTQVIAIAVTDLVSSNMDDEFEEEKTEIQQAITQLSDEQNEIFDKLKKSGVELPKEITGE